MGNLLSKEIDIIGLIKKVLSETKLLIIFIVVFAVIGVVVALSTPKTYTSSVVLAPEITGMGMSQSLGDLASMIDVNISSSGNSTDAIYPDIYPDIFASNDFVLGLFDVKVKLMKSGIEKNYYDHLMYDKKIPFWEYPMIWLSNILSSTDDDTKAGQELNPFKLTKIQDNICSQIKRNIACLIDQKTSVITISVTDYDPQVAAIMVDTIQKRLQDYITDYRTQKARNDLDFAQNVYIEAKAQYVKAQQLYSSYMDANADVVLQSFKSKQEEMENEMQLRYNIYTMSVQQLNSAKLKVQEKTPAFTVIQTATVPLKASSMSSSTKVILFIFWGFLADAIWVLWGRNAISKIRKK